MVKKEEKKAEKTVCKDKNCPVHSSLSVRGRSFRGKVLSAKMHGTVVVGWERRVFVKKYERYEKKKSKVYAHLPACMEVKEGDVVEIKETRPLSKLKHFVVTAKLEKK